MNIYGLRNGALTVGWQPPEDAWCRITADINPKSSRLKLRDVLIATRYGNRQEGFRKYAYSGLYDTNIADGCRPLSDVLKIGLKKLAVEIFNTGMANPRCVVFGRGRNREPIGWTVDGALRIDRGTIARGSTGVLHQTFVQERTGTLRVNNHNTMFSLERDGEEIQPMQANTDTIWLRPGTYTVRVDLSSIRYLFGGFHISAR